PTARRSSRGGGSRRRRGGQGRWACVWGSWKGVSLSSSSGGGGCGASHSSLLEGQRKDKQGVHGVERAQPAEAVSGGDEREERLDMDGGEHDAKAHPEARRHLRREGEQQGDEWEVGEEPAQRPVGIECFAVPHQEDARQV